MDQSKTTGRVNIPVRVGFTRVVIDRTGVHPISRRWIGQEVQMTQFLSPARQRFSSGERTRLASSRLTDLDRLPWGQATIRQVIDAPLDRSEQTMLKLTLSGLLILVLGQKLAFPPVIELGFYSTFGLVAFLLIRNFAMIDPVRLIGYVLVMATCVLVTLLSPLHPSFSVEAVVFLVIIHMPFTLVVQVRRTFYLKLIRYFQWMGVVVATLVYIQWAQQLVGMRMISLEDIIPTNFLYPGYNYIQKIDYYSQYYKPNGFLMLETSHTSQLLAIVTLIELCLFRRVFMIGYLFIAQLITFGGTGMLLTVVTLPFVFRYVSLRLVIAGIVVAPLALFVAAHTGVLDNAIGRTAEFDKPNTSGNGRFVSHFVIAAKNASVDADHALFGIGAGRVSPFVTDKTTVFLPISKLVVEYGIPAALLFIVWISYCFFTAGAPMVITWPVFVLFNLIGGTLLIPINTYYCLFLTGMFVPNRAVGVVRSRLFRRDRLPRVAVRSRAKPRDRTLNHSRTEAAGAQTV
jgi:hypothetical protein